MLAMCVVSLYVTLLSVSPTSGLVSVDGRSDTGRENYNTLCTVTVYYVHIHVYTYILPVNVRTYAYNTDHMYISQSIWLACFVVCSSVHVLQLHAATVSYIRRVCTCVLNVSYLRQDLNVYRLTTCLISSQVSLSTMLP